MKRKQAGLISIIMICATAGALVGYALMMRDDGKQTIRYATIIGPPDLAVPGTAELNEMQQLDADMRLLARPTGTDRVRVNLALFGWKPRKKGQRPEMAASEEITLPEDIDYKVTFAFSSGNHRFCLIAGKFFTEGSDLPDGGTIKKIEARRVLIRIGDVTRWVLLDQSKGYEEYDNGL